MSYASDAIRQFHELFGIPGERVWGEIVEGREALHHEEHHEVCEALRACQSGTPEQLEAVARELADSLVIAYGTADVLDLNLDLALRRVMEANMAKLPVCANCHGAGATRRQSGVDGSTMRACGVCEGTGKGKPLKNDLGKVLKPKSWQPPSMAGVLR